MSESTPLSIPRRHDLDALRAIAMLLGIVLHGAISFIPFAGAWWGIQDTQTSKAFGVFLAAIHGFRMPVFFLISGFFTAMLWRKRGLWALLVHRFKRIFLPMLIGLFTIIPVTWAVSAYVRSAANTEPNSGVEAGASQAQQTAGQLDIWAAAALDDVDTMTQFVQQGDDLEQKNQDGSTPLHVAAFFGRARVAKVLLDAGADVEVTNGRGTRPVELLNVPWGLTKSIADAVGVPVDEAAVNAGRREIGALLGMKTDDGPTLEQTDGASSQPAGLAGLMAFIRYFPLLGHLWFLWFLCWLVAGFAMVVTIGRWMGLRGVPAGMVLSGWRYWWLLPLTAIPQYFMGQAVNNFGPDTSLGLFPIPTVLAYYAIFFGFGAFYYQTDDRDGQVGRYWWLALPVALLVIFPLGFNQSLWGESLSRPLIVFFQVAYAWLVSFGMMGAFRHFFSGESKAMRYVSDSSYWLYLAHIPLIMFIQFLVRDWPLSAWIKFPLVCAVTSAILLLSYQLFVRYTPVGTLLNGPRRRPLKPNREQSIDPTLLDMDTAG